MNDEYQRDLYQDVFSERPVIPLWQQILRWIALIPGAVAASIIATFLMNIVMWLGSSRFGEDSWFSYLYREIAVQAVCGAVFVYSAGYIAPRGKIPTTITFSALLLFVSGVAFFGALSQEDWMSLLGVVCVNIGSIAVAVSVATGQIDYE